MIGMKARFSIGLVAIGFLVLTVLTVDCGLWTVDYGLCTASATDLPLRGIARGESKITVGDKAPLITPELEQAHKERKVIALQLGFPPHCPWCDRMDRYIKEIMKETNNFDGEAIFIQTQIEHAKMIAPPSEGMKLKEAFGVQGQPWLFIIDKEGTVRFVYKVFVGSDTFRKNIEELLVREALDEMERAEKKGDSHEGKSSIP